MAEVILAKYGEIALKGLNKSTFENILMKNIRRRLRGLGKFSISKAQSTIYIESENEESDLDEAYLMMKKVFGISTLSKATVTEKIMMQLLLKLCDILMMNYLLQERLR